MNKKDMNIKQNKNIDHRLKKLDRLARLLDNFIQIPGTKIKIGIDSLIGLIPGVGDFLAFLISLYIIFEAIRFKLPNPILFKMLINLLIDWLGGTIPILGDIFDVAWKANLRNVKLIREYLSFKKIPENT